MRGGLVRAVRRGLDVGAVTGGLVVGLQQTERTHARFSVQYRRFSSVRGGLV